MIEYPNLFSEFKVRNYVYRNRILCSPTTNHAFQGAEPYPTQATITHFANKAKGGSASVVVGGMQVERGQPNDGMHVHFTLDSFDSNYSMRGFVRMTDAIRFYGAAASLELLFPESKSYAASPMERRGAHMDEMPESEMLRILDCFGDAVRGAKRAGFDSVFVMGVAHGMILNTFISPYHNKRTDKYGGSLENRARFPVMLLDRVRQEAGDDMIVELRVNGSDMLDGGLTVYECAEFLKMLEGKADIIHVSAGDQSKPVNRTAVHPTGFSPPSSNAFLAAAIKSAGISIPIATVGNNTDIELCERIIADGSADFIDMARATIADPELPSKAYSGRADTVVPCIKCFACLDDYKTSNYFSCSVNPVQGREDTLPAMIRPVEKPRKIAVVGGGPAGMRAALTAADRGHEVTLFEQANTLGGTLRASEHVSFKYGLKDYKNWLVRTVKAHDHITLRLGEKATSEILEEEGFADVIAAVGAKPFTPDIPGVNSPFVMTAVEAYDKTYAIGQQVVIVGGGEVGCETALHLCGNGRSVTVLEMGDKIAPDANMTNRLELLEKLDENVTCVTDSKCTLIGDRFARAETKDGSAKDYAADTVILAAGMRADTLGADALASKKYRLLRVGDCVRAGNVRFATRTAFDAALQLV